MASMSVVVPTVRSPPKPYCGSVAGYVSSTLKGDTGPEILTVPVIGVGISDSLYDQAEVRKTVTAPTCVYCDRYRLYDCVFTPSSSVTPFTVTPLVSVVSAH